MPLNTLALQASDLSCERDDRHLFSDLTFSLSWGECVRVLGPNGAGKTTLLRGLVGLNHYVDGAMRWSASVDGRPPFLYSGHKTGVSAHLTVAENLRYLVGLSGVVLTDAQVDEALASVGLTGFDDSLGSELSAGQQRRIALAQLYVEGMPRCWVLDEPFVALDKKGVAELERHLARHCALGGAVLLTTHHEPTALAPRPLMLQGAA
ncbi:cytochrome c biogenesis heme-transporting ATPase CcmA [Salinispirillum marinum]|uniref:Cytochrome c biogenesis heme-transporting ATPase CcmA n=2 Tax=Saccharospirillaceae TaxID=255527 RepID=A0ABV8BIH1_9GAMM